MALFRRRLRWAGVDFAALRPARAVESTADETTGQVVLLMPRFRGGLLGRYLQPRLRPEKQHIRVPLEARGSWVWSQLDGQRTVGELAAGFRDAFPDDAEQAEKRVSQFVYSMFENRFVKFVNLPER